MRLKVISLFTYVQSFEASVRGKLVSFFRFLVFNCLRKWCKKIDLKLDVFLVFFCASSCAV